MIWWAALINSIAAGGAVGFALHMLWGLGISDCRRGCRGVCRPRPHEPHGVMQQCRHTSVLSGHVRQPIYPAQYHGGHSWLVERKSGRGGPPREHCSYHPAFRRRYRRDLPHPRNDRRRPYCRPLPRCSPRDGALTTHTHLGGVDKLRVTALAGLRRRPRVGRAHPPRPPPIARNRHYPGPPRPGAHRGSRGGGRSAETPGVGSG